MVSFVVVVGVDVDVDDDAVDCSVESWDDWSANKDECNYDRLRDIMGCAGRYQYAAGRQMPSVSIQLTIPIPTSRQELRRSSFSSPPCPRETFKRKETN